MRGEWPRPRRSVSFFAHPTPRPAGRRTPRTAALPHHAMLRRVSSRFIARLNKNKDLRGGVAGFPRNHVANHPFWLEPPYAVQTATEHPLPTHPPTPHPPLR